MAWWQLRHPQPEKHDPALLAIEGTPLNMLTAPQAETFDKAEEAGVAFRLVHPRFGVTVVGINGRDPRD